MIETERLIIRPWQAHDRAPFAAINADPRVMETLVRILDRAESDAMVDRLEAIQAGEGHTFWPIERKSDNAIIGFCGLVRGDEGTGIMGEPEIGWRLAYEAWGQGFAREAAEACLDWGWANLRDDGIAAITAATNRRSWGLMERLGMTRCHADDFDHPKVPDESPLKRHVVYRIARP